MRLHISGGQPRMRVVRGRQIADATGFKNVVFVFDENGEAIVNSEDIFPKELSKIKARYTVKEYNENEKPVEKEVEKVVEKVEIPERRPEIQALAKKLMEEGRLSEFPLNIKTEGIIKKIKEVI